MSDERLRELERRWKETGAVEDEAAWLRARVQAGELEEGRLGLAAYLGDPACSAVLPPAEAARALAKVSRTVWAAAFLRILDACSEAGAADPLLQEVRETLTALAGSPAEELRKASARLSNELGTRSVAQRPHSPPLLDFMKKATLALGRQSHEGLLRDARTALSWGGTALGKSALQQDLVPWALGY